MELRAFAYKVLHGNSLANKLIVPGELSDDEPGPPLVAPPWPGRPPELRLDRAAPQPEFPQPHQLVSDRARATVLHFFANHELLALELMALLILRFPDVPPAFRRGLAATMRDEQEHFSLYTNRMKELGLEFGELPVNGYFWNCISRSESPLEFVTQLSLTFEQANIDYAAHYARVFESQGDSKTAEILERIYLDELGHVGHGLLWFNRWRTAGEGEWEAYQRHLRAPLSPSRAKGPEYRADARLQIGFSHHFVEELQVYSHSKGRPPRVFYFNPACELELVHGKSYVPNQRVAGLARDYASSLMFLARRDDAVLVPSQPSSSYLAGLQSLGFDLPEFVPCGEFRRQDVQRALRERKLGGLHPWGWSPASWHLLSSVAEQCGSGWIPDKEQLHLVRPLYSKVWSADLLRGLWDSRPAWRELLGPPWMVGRAAQDTETALKYVQGLHERWSGWVAVKAPFGSSGQNMIRLERRKADPAELSWIRKTIAEQGAVVVEPWLDTVANFSIQLRVEEDRRVHEQGLTRFFTNRRGQYVGHALGRPLADLDEEMLRCCHGEGGRTLGALTVLREVSREVGNKLAAAEYRGPAGVDLLFHRWEGQLLLKPIVEVNPRFTMGLLALELGNHLRPGCVGIWRHLPRRELEWRGITDLSLLMKALADVFPPRLHEGRLESGAFTSNDPLRAKEMLGVVLVGQRVEECQLGLERLLNTLALPPTDKTPHES